MSTGITKGTSFISGGATMVTKQDSRQGSSGGASNGPSSQSGGTSMGASGGGGGPGPSRSSKGLRCLQLDPSGADVTIGGSQRLINDASFGGGGEAGTGLPSTSFRV